MTLQDIETKMADIETKAKSLYSTNRLLLCLLIIPILILKYRSIIINLLVSDSKQITQNAVKQDAQLATKQNDANTQADKIIQQADQTKEVSDSQTVDENWNKK